MRKCICGPIRDSLKLRPRKSGPNWKCSQRTPCDKAEAREVILRFWCRIRPSDYLTKIARKIRGVNQLDPVLPSNFQLKCEAAQHTGWTFDTGRYADARALSHRTALHRISRLAATFSFLPPTVHASHSSCARRCSWHLVLDVGLLER